MDDFRQGSGSERLDTKRRDLLNVMRGSVNEKRELPQDPREPLH